MGLKQAGAHFDAVSTAPSIRALVLVRLNLDCLSGNGQVFEGHNDELSRLSLATLCLAGTLWTTGHRYSVLPSSVLQ